MRNQDTIQENRNEAAVFLIKSGTLRFSFALTQRTAARLVLSHHRLLWTLSNNLDWANERGRTTTAPVAKTKRLAPKPPAVHMRDTNNHTPPHTQRLGRSPSRTHRSPITTFSFLFWVFSFLICWFFVAKRRKIRRWRLRNEIGIPFRHATKSVIVMVGIELANLDTEIHS